MDNNKKQERIDAVNELLSLSDRSKISSANDILKNEPNITTERRLALEQQIEDVIKSAEQRKSDLGGQK